MSKVSVIVPIYNAGKTLDKCVKSILKQTFSDFELILVNDGSTDNSLSICKKYRQQDSRVIVIDKKNEGSVATRRKGVESSRSNYILFVDADDWIDRKMIEELYNETKNNLDIIVCNTYKVLGKGLIKQKNHSIYFKEDKIYNKEKVKKDLVVAYLHGHPFPAFLHGKLFKEELVRNSGKYLDRISFLGDDLFYNLEMFLKADRVKVIDKPLYYYRLGGLTSKYMPSLFDDMVNGFEIQKEVVDQYFQSTKEIEYNGICIMLLNTFKTCLYNLFISDLTKLEIKERIREYVNHCSVIESIHNTGSIRFFSKEYLNAINHNDIDYLYQLGEQQYIRSKPKRTFINTLSKLAII
ncbi:glycosyltransferase family 2 protein [Lederbergia citrea]|uniref:Glycosyltransferase family 2 protein n=1 Tax=Lederbergia citrea TaxID=2833581 RepID=A0A942UU30_9BACI|nr:glycosyltransferase family 2 protein [Lederbergia citrea]MBS4205798.1 glycosyltransferase family 2 protein [Lederbergia citrea]MBS4224753.1 glycosyltransferase family 2 protein [Lederbergia citrea]